jgi:transposase
MENLLMSANERRRLAEFSRVKDGLSSVAEAARQLRLSERQGRRLWAQYRRKGDAGLIHGLRGKPGNAGQAQGRAQVLALYRRKYLEFGPAHAADMMARQEKRVVSRKTLWRWLKAEGLVVDRRKVRQHRSRRPRRPCVGELVQMDGSTHAWFGTDISPCVLFVMIDDASSHLHARFYETEDTRAAFDLFGHYVRRHGLPRALYVDFDSIYVVNDAPAREACQEAGRPEPLTQFGRAMQTLGVAIIGAHSPQAKGRVERANGTLQDRLVKELKLAGITTLAAANAFLEKFLEDYNERFSQPPASGINVHRHVPPGLRLAEVLCPQEQRVVGEDWCVRYENRILQIAKRHEALALAGRKILVLSRADGTLKLVRGDKVLVWQEVATRPTQPTPRKPIRYTQTPWRPGPDHPWKRPAITPPPTVTAPPAAPSPKFFRGVVKPVSLQSVSLRSPAFRSTGLTTPHPPLTLLLRR